MRKPEVTFDQTAEKLPRGIWVLVGAAFVIAIGYGLITPVLPQYARSFNVSVMAASAIVSAFGIARLVFAPASGVLINRFGERHIYMTGVFIVAVSTLATAFASNYWLLLLYRGLGGVGSTLFTVSATGMIVRMAPAHMRGRASSAYGGAFLAGNITGPILGGLLGHISLRLPFFCYTAALLIAIVVIWVLLPPSALNDVSVTNHRVDSQIQSPAPENRLRVRDVAKDSAYLACWSPTSPMVGETLACASRCFLSS